MSNAYRLPLAQNACSSSRLAHGARKGMPLRPPRALKSSIEAYGQRSTFRPFTVIPETTLPAEGMMVTTILFFASVSWMVSPLRAAAYCARAGPAKRATARAASARARFIGVYSGSAKLNRLLPAASATYCRPLTAKLIGAAALLPPVW